MARLESPPGPPPRPMRSSIARRKSGRSARAIARRHDACPGFRRRSRRSLLPPNPAEIPQTRARASNRARQQGARVRKRPARRARGLAASIRTAPNVVVQTQACRRACRRRVAMSTFGKGCRPIDFAERPQSNRRTNHCRGTRVRSKSKGQIVVTARLEQGERALQVNQRLAVLAREKKVSPVTRCATPASGELGLALMSLRKAAACARIDGNSPRA